LVLDDVFASLDAASQQEIGQRLQQAHNTTIIQVLIRKQDLLTFITQIILFENNCLVPSSSESFVSAINNGPFPIPGPPPDSITLLQNQLVEFSNVTVRYENRCIVKNINWTINKASFWQLKGPNGSGKTTLLSIINGDNTKAYGQNLTLFGYKRGSGESIWDIKQYIGYFSQQMVRFFERRDSALNMVAGGLLDSVGLYQKPTDLMQELSLQWLTVLQLTSKKDTPFQECTGGEQRLLLLARAMIKHPPLLILDEPTNRLADAEAALLVALVNQIAEETNTAIVFVSHRTEAELNPKHIFELIPTSEGSLGRQVR
jgi:molybdate transport system ATP-binding protein